MNKLYIFKGVTAGLALIVSGMMSGHAVAIPKLAKIDSGYKDTTLIHGHHHGGGHRGGRHRGGGHHGGGHYGGHHGGGHRGHYNGHHGGHHGGYHGGHHHHHHRYGRDFAIDMGLNAANDIIDDSIDRSYYYSPPVRAAPRLSDSHIDWCAKHYKSYRTSDNTFLGSDGHRHYCHTPAE